jgi:aarF domain-containing kinase
MTAFPLALKSIRKNCFDQYIPPYFLLFLDMARLFGRVLPMCTGLAVGAYMQNKMLYPGGSSPKIWCDVQKNVSANKFIGKTAPVTFKTSKFKLILRLGYLSAIFLPAAILFPFWWLFNRKYIEDGTHSKWWLVLLRETLEMGGPLYIKLGQWFSTRTDIFSPSVCAVFQPLQSSVRAHPFEHTRKVIRDTTGLELESLFGQFEVVPIGVGAIAQVHHATLLDGSQVAVKILHPNIHAIFHVDFVLLRYIGKFIDKCFAAAKYFRVSQEIDTFSQMMYLQSNLSVEGENLQRFTSNFKSSTCIRFPKYHPALSGMSMLVEDFVDGIQLAEYIARGSKSFNTDIAKLGLEAFAQMVLKDNFTHSDMHPGNILITLEKDGRAFHLPKESDLATWNQLLSELKQTGYKPVIHVLDVGLVNVLSPGSLVNLRDSFEAGVNRNGRLLAELIVSRSVDPSSVIEIDEFTDSIVELITVVDLDSKGQLLLNQLFALEIITNFVKLARKHHITMTGVILIDYRTFLVFLSRP